MFIFKFIYNLFNPFIALTDCGKTNYPLIKIKKQPSKVTFFGANDVDIYNSLALLTIDIKSIKLYKD